MSALSKAGITFGKVVAGAALATGAVLMLTAVTDMSVGQLGDAITKAFQNIGTRIEGWLGGLSAGASTSGPSSIEQWFADPSNRRAAIGLGGAAVLGGALMLKSHMDEKHELQQDLEAMERGNAGQGRFAANYQRAQIDGIMKARAIAHDPAYFGGMPGPQR